MPAPSLDVLNDPATLVEAAVKKLLTKKPKTVDAFVSRETSNETAERVDITFMLGKWSGRWGVDRAEVVRHSAWHYELQLAIWTKRLAADKTRHGFLRGRVRTLLDAAVLDPAFLAWHTLASLNEESGSEQIAVGDDMDSSVLKYTGLITIRSDAWPLV